MTDQAPGRPAGRQGDQMSRQTIDVDTLVRAALDARHSWTDTNELVELLGGTIRYLIERGVDVTCDGHSYRPLSAHSWQRLVEQRGLLNEDGVTDDPKASTVAPLFQDGTQVRATLEGEYFTDRHGRAMIRLRDDATGEIDELDIHPRAAFAALRSVLELHKRDTIEVAPESDDAEWTERP